MGIDRYVKASRKVVAKVLSDGTSIIASSSVHGPTQMRCPSCKGMCAQTRSTTGKVVYKCSGCGTEFVGRAL